MYSEVVYRTTKLPLEKSLTDAKHSILNIPSFLGGWYLNPTKNIQTLSNDTNEITPLHKVFETLATSPWTHDLPRIGWNAWKNKNKNTITANKFQFTITANGKIWANYYNS